MEHQFARLGFGAAVVVLALAAGVSVAGGGDDGRFQVYAPYVGTLGRCDYRSDFYDCWARTWTAEAERTDLAVETLQARATWPPGPYEPKPTATIRRAVMPVLLQGGQVLADLRIAAGDRGGAAPGPRPSPSATATRTPTATATRMRRATRTPRGTSTPDQGRMATVPACGPGTLEPGDMTPHPGCWPYNSTLTTTPAPEAADTQPPTATLEPTPTAGVMVQPAPVGVATAASTPVVQRFPLVLVWRPRSTRTPRPPRPAAANPNAAAPCVPVAHTLASLAGPGRWCSAGPMGQGIYYTAGHCLTKNPLELSVDGVRVMAWQHDDKGRDLAQVKAGEGGAVATLGRLVPGDALELRLSRGALGARYAEDAWGHKEGDLWFALTAPYDGAHLLGIACIDGPGQVVQGDSGGAVVRAADGALGGIVVGAEGFPADADPWCGADQDVIIELVP